MAGKEFWEKRNAASLETARKEAAQTWQIVENWLALRGTSYLGGAEFSIGDIPVGIHARRWFGFPIERPAMPHLKAWYDRIALRPGFIEHIAGPMS